MPCAYAFPLPHVEAALPPLGVRTGELLSRAAALHLPMQEQNRRHSS